MQTCCLIQTFIVNVLDIADLFMMASRPSKANLGGRKPETYFAKVAEEKKET